MFFAVGVFLVVRLNVTWKLLSLSTSITTYKDTLDKLLLNLC